MKTASSRQPTLFDLSDHEVEHVPRPVDLFRPQRIILAKGSLTTPKRRSLAERICAAYPGTRVEEQPAIAHNKIDLGISDPLQLHYEGRRTLVLGEHNERRGPLGRGREHVPKLLALLALRLLSLRLLVLLPGRHAGGAVLADGKGVHEPGRDPRPSGPAGPDDRPAGGVLPRQVTGRHGPGPAHRLLAGDDPVLRPAPARRLRVLSKSADFENVLDLDHGGHTVLCWSLNPPEVRKDYEVVTPPIAERIEAMAQCAAAGYPIRVMLMPIIPVPDWRRHTATCLEQLLTQVHLDRITLGGVCSYGPALNVTHEKLGTDNAIVKSLTVLSDGPDDGRTRYSHALRADLYAFMRDTIRRYQPELTVALCMESHALATEVGLAGNIGKCNCIL